MTELNCVHLALATPLWGRPWIQALGSQAWGSERAWCPMAQQTLAWEEEEVEIKWEPDCRGLSGHATKLGLYFL